uniref:Aldehyde dehydrogenase n=1 Tax=Populus davidiana TaxID=266767 RepID=A0A6M2FA47_9ROSI
MEGLEGTLAELRDTFKSGRTRSAAWRKSQLRAMIEFVQDNEEEIFKVLDQDVGKHPVEAYRDEVGIVAKSAKLSLSCVEKWMAPKKGNLPLAFFPASAEVMPEPFGVVLIMGSWNFPISLTLDPLIGAISAGNVVVLKPSELSPACSSFLAETIPKYLDPKSVKVIEGGIDVCEQLLKQNWDKIFFTGSQRVGRIVMTAAAQHLTPVTLELGGKSPAILDSSSNPTNMKVIAKRIVAAKWGSCSGQACIAIDYMLVEEKFASYLIDMLGKTIKQFFGENPRESKSLCKILNKNNFKRLLDLLKDPQIRASVVYGGSVDEETMYIEPTILLNPPLDSQIMTEEIFGPLLPIITLNNIHDSIEFISSRPKPLVIYAFTRDETFKKQILSKTSSGSVTFNDTLLQFVCDSLPFGGVGQSGFGRYHGKYSFDTFSHEKAILQRRFFPELEPRYPPWNNFKFQFIKLLYAFNYVGLVLLLLGLKK